MTFKNSKIYPSLSFPPLVLEVQSETDVEENQVLDVTNLSEESTMPNKESTSTNLRIPSISYTISKSESNNKLNGTACLHSLDYTYDYFVLILLAILFVEFFPAAFLLCSHKNVRKYRYCRRCGVQSKRSSKKLKFYIFFAIFQLHLIIVAASIALLVHFEVFAKINKLPPIKFMVPRKGMN